MKHDDATVEAITERVLARLRTGMLPDPNEALVAATDRLVQAEGHEDAVAILRDLANEVEMDFRKKAAREDDD